MRIVDLGITEGVKINTPQRKQALSNDDFRIGIEYEFQVLNRNGDIVLKGLIPGIEELFTTHKIPFRNIVGEHDNQIELITEVMTIPEGMLHLKRMFDVLSNGVDGYTFKTSHNSGLHISISLANESKPFNPLKFALFMNSDYIHSMFDERTYVKTYDSIITKYINQFKYDYTNREIIEKLEATFNEKLGHGDGEKHFTFKIGDFLTYNGRIELRFFGGEQYQLSYREVEQQLARSLYILGVAHGDKFNKDYYRILSNKIQKLKDEIHSFDSTMDEISHLFVQSGKTPPSTLLMTLQTEVYGAMSDPEQHHRVIEALPALKRFLPTSYRKIIRKFMVELGRGDLDSHTMRSIIGFMIDDHSLIDVLTDKMRAELLTQSSLLTHSHRFNDIDFILAELVNVKSLDPKDYVMVKPMPTTEDDTMFDEFISVRLSDSPETTLLYESIVVANDPSSEVYDEFIDFMEKILDICMGAFHANENAYISPNKLLVLARYRRDDFKDILKRYMKIVETTDDEEYIELVSPVIRKISNALHNARD